MLTKDEMYDLYFNKGCVIAVRLDEFGAFVGDLIDRHQIIFHEEDSGIYKWAKQLEEASNIYKLAKQIVEKDEDRIPVIYAVYCRSWLVASTGLYSRKTINECRGLEVILYSAQDTVKNIKARIAEQTHKIKDNNDEIKKCKNEIKELYGKMGDLRLKSTSTYFDDILKDKKWLKKYGMNRGD